MLRGANPISLQHGWAEIEHDPRRVAALVADRDGLLAGCPDSVPLGFKNPVTVADLGVASDCWPGAGMITSGASVVDLQRVALHLAVPGSGAAP